MNVDVPGRPRLEVVPTTLREANALVARWHRHHRPVQGAKFAILANLGDEPVGAAIVGRPLARMLQDGRTAEVTRLVTDGTPNACSLLYGACWRAWRAMGGRRLYTYILAAEPGTSLLAAGWRRDAETPDREAGWNTPGRPRLEGLPKREKFGEDLGQIALLDDFEHVPQGAKVRWVAEATGRTA